MSDAIDDLTRRVGELVDSGYAPDASWRLRDVAVPLALDLLAEIRRLNELLGFRVEIEELRG